VGAIQFLALICFVVAAILAAIGARTTTRSGWTDWWAVLVALGLALWLLSETKVIH
jgi:hypothetical protein